MAEVAMVARGHSKHPQEVRSQQPGHQTPMKGHQENAENGQVDRCEQGHGTQTIASHGRVRHFKYSNGSAAILDVCDNPFVQAQTQAASPVREAFYSKWLERNL